MAIFQTTPSPLYPPPPLWTVTGLFIWTPRAPHIIIVELSGSVLRHLYHEIIEHPLKRSLISCRESRWQTKKSGLLSWLTATNKNVWFVAVNYGDKEEMLWPCVDFHFPSSSGRQPVHVHTRTYTYIQVISCKHCHCSSCNDYETRDIRENCAGT